jgi:WD40 repeat protein
MTNPINNPINSCNPSTSSAVIRRNSQLLELPFELVIEILTRLNGEDNRACRLLCKQWDQVLNREDIWQRLFEKHFPDINSEKIKNFQTAYKLYLNLTNGVCTSRTLEGHHSGIKSIVTFDGGFISGSGDKTIKIWDLKTLTCIATLQGHTRPVESLAIFNGKLISGSYDNTISIWDLNTRTCIAVLEGHTAPVTSLAISNGRLISGSRNNTIKIWDLNTYLPICTATLEGHRDPSGSLIIVDDGRLISVCSNEYDNENSIKIWDLSTEPPTCIATLEGHTDSVTSLVSSDGRLISGSDDKTIKIWDLKKFTCTATLKWHAFSVSSLAIFNGKLIAGSSACMIKIWDLKTLACTATLAGHDRDVGSLAVSNRTLISGSSDYKIKVWDFMANNDEVFKEIAGQLKDEDPSLTEQAIRRFLRMPKSAKNKIYGELYKIIKPRLTKANDYYGCAEHAFHDQHGQSATSLEKAQAIRNYLAAEKELEQPTELPREPLLKHLGIVTPEQFSDILHCRPEHLQQRGILSPEDLQLICSLSLDVQALAIEEDSGLGGNFRDNAVKLEADRRKRALSGLSQQMSQEVASKIQEITDCACNDVLLYEGDSPWIGFQNKLDAFRAKFDAIVLECDGSPKLIVEAFKLAKYNELARELNALVEEFQTLDRNHQIVKLRTYIHQQDISRAWEKCPAVGTQRLINLPTFEQKTLPRLLQMGLVNLG